MRTALVKKARSLFIILETFSGAVRIDICGLIKLVNRFFENFYMY